MSVVSIPPSAPTLANPGDLGGRPRRWTREEYYRAAELGLFRPDERLELLEGEIIQKMTQNPPHTTSLSLSLVALESAFAGRGYFVRIQAPISLPGDSEPEPDLAVVAGCPRDYQTQHPVAANVLLLVEVSDTTLGFDRRRKAAAYAAAGIREYWIVNVIDRQLEVHRDPSGSAYGLVTVHAPTDSVSLLGAPQATIPVADLLPSP